MENEKIYDSGQSEPDDDFWFEQGKKMVEESLPSIRDAAKSLMTSLGILNAIYLGILGFADLVPKTAPKTLKGLFVSPLIFWLIALYCCLCVMMTEKSQINLHSPDNIRQNTEDALKSKQFFLKLAFWLLTIGLILAIVLAAFCPELQALLE
ncbi:MAG: hypothetical protein GY845_30810 [Planctomycetes bacterium]|nr:hypothetical protein [Planctomycetota bacterium]